MTEKKPAKKTEVALVAEVQTVTPMDLIVQAQNSGASIEQMQQLFELKLRHEENEAKKAWHEAVAAFKSEAITILKDAKVSYSTSKGQTEYNHARLGNITKIVIPFLSKYGLSHRWTFVQEGAKVAVTCILSHRLGHSESVTLEAGKDDSGGKNSIQAIGSSISYLERYTFLALTGLAAEDQDDDGGGSEEDDVEYISESQVCDLEALVEQAKVPMKGFLVWLKVSDLAETPVTQYEAAVEKLNAKIGGK